ncbi:MAG: glycosyltransferase family 2 protein [Candidatus Pacebacteria bacterium]|nr:glycosyltransferase family 2 protein [Candidatus Paceibacterota bacterium]
MISIITVNYNGKRWLKRFFDSFLNQTYDNFELIFVDNDSTDDSVDFIKEKYFDNRVKVIKSEKNLGFAGGNNLGISVARGDYLLLINNDTWVDEDFLEKIRLFYDKSSYCVVSPVVIPYYSEDRFIEKEKKYNIDFLGHPFISCDVKKFFYLSGACLFCKKDFYLRTGGLDNDFFMYFEETDWFWRLRLFGYTFGTASGVFFHHEGGGGSNGIKYKNFLWRNQNNLQMLLKNYSVITLLFLLPIYFLLNILESVYFIITANPRISYSYYQGWLFNLSNIRKIWKKRKLIQERRVVGDIKVFKEMYLGFAKLNHLLLYLKK